MECLSYESLMELIVRALNKMDEHLSGHGERVAYRVMRAMQKEGSFSEEEICKTIWTILLHDIGNYHHIDIFDLRERETRTASAHATYGYLFLKYFGPYPEDAPLILYHHSSRGEIKDSNMSESLKWISYCLMVADTVDLYCVSFPNTTKEDALKFLEGMSDDTYSPIAIKAICEVEKELPESHEYMHRALLKELSMNKITAKEQEALLKVLISSIDFRSRVTALHCSIIIKVSDLLAQLCGVSERERQEIHIGATLHDLGKIAIPINILENPGKLIGDDWEIMKAHVVITEEILDGAVSETVKNIAVRHHETLDGTGYPRGLNADDLTLPQRIIAVADVVSALSEERSYKAAFPLVDIVKILDGMCERGKLDSDVVSVLKENKAQVIKTARKAGAKAKEEYQQIWQESNQISFYRYEDKNSAKCY